MLGVIADDFTGAADIADVLVETGFRVAVIPGSTLERQALPAHLDALVVALKSRTAQAADAVRDSIIAYELLSAAGCRQFYFKYCSTFDSTPRGNIGQVIDALLEASSSPATVVLPAYPANGRTVYQGHLFVGQELLAESAMRSHPLTPMLDSDVPRLLRPQTRNRVELISLRELRVSAATLRVRLAELASDGSRQNSRTSIVIDAISDDDLRTVAEAVSDWPLLTGSAGLASVLIGPSAVARNQDVFAGGRVALCASASAASRRQVTYAQRHMPTIKLDVTAAARTPRREIDRLVAQVLSLTDGFSNDQAVLVYVVDAADRSATVGTDTQLAHQIEYCMAELAAELVRAGVRQLLVAGGETSGAVVERLDALWLTVGARIGPGVPWTASRLAGGQQINLALKSGNFGPEDIYVSAWQLLQSSDAAL